MWIDAGPDGEDHVHMPPTDTLLRPEPLPVEQLLFDGPLARIGAFRCPAGHPLFADSGPIVNPIFVFPRTAVWIQHEGRAPFLSDPTIAPLYNRGQTYRRKLLSETGDHCEWFALTPGVLAEIAAARDPRAAERPWQPFAETQTAVDSRTYLFQRQLVEALAAGRCDPLFVEEQVVWVAMRVLDSAADRTGLPQTRDRVSTRAARLHRDHAEHARQILTLRFGGSSSLDELARLVGVSVFHLCRVFRRQTGLTLHEYRTELRLRHALERLPERGADLTRIALDVGFSSHSHFTAAFRRAFGLTPSAFARQGRTARRSEG
jgi:AraC family transcriptional regulator